MHLLAEYIKEIMAASEKVDGPYTHNLSSDTAVHEPSVLVPDDIKDKIFNYFDKMGLSQKPRKKKLKRTA